MPKPWDGGFGLVDNAMSDLSSVIDGKALRQSKSRDFYVVEARSSGCLPWPQTWFGSGSTSSSPPGPI
jgi:hypothetical protein